MYKYSRTSERRLAECHKDLQILMREVLKYFDHTIICGYRGEEEQSVAFKAGNSELLFPNSKHNRSPAMAVDIVPYPIDWYDKPTFCYLAGIVIATAKSLKRKAKMKYSVRWGGDWNMRNVADTLDLGHFELIRGK